MSTRPKKRCPVHGWTKVNRFHIIPKSRGGGLGDNVIDDFCYGCHSLYHRLFQNRTPEEILKDLDGFFRSMGLTLPKYLIQNIGRAYWGNQHDDLIEAYLVNREWEGFH